MAKAVIIRSTIKEINSRLYLRKDWQVWQKLAGVWRSKRLIDPVRWQRKIRRES